MAPPDCLRVGCAPSKWLPSSSAEPPGSWDAGHWDLGRDSGGGQPSSLACVGIGQWVWGSRHEGGGGGVAVEGRTNEAEPGRAGGGPWVSTLTSSEKARKPCHLKSPRRWGKDLVGGTKTWWHPQQDSPPPYGQKKPERRWEVPLHLQRWPQGGGRGPQRRR